MWQNFLTLILLIASHFPVLAQEDVLSFDVQDKKNLTIYTKQGYYLNSRLRDRIPLQTILPYLNLAKAQTCSNLIKNNASYLSQIYLNPGNPISSIDFKLYYLLKEALLKRGETTNQVVYRGNKSCSYLISEMGNPIPYFVEMGFMSTSLSEESAQVFTKYQNDLDGSNSKEKRGCILLIETSSGKRIADATGNYNNENEVLVPPETLFQVKEMPSNGQQIVFQLKEMATDSLEAKGIMANLDFARFASAAQINYPALVPYNQMSPPSAPIDPKDLSPQALQSYDKMASEVESACQEAYRFFSTNPELRAKLKKEKPVYDLSDRTLNPDDYIYSE